MALGLYITFRLLDVADLSVDVAEKVLREELSAEGRQEAYIGRLVDELTAVQTGGDPKN